MVCQYLKFSPEAHEEQLLHGIAQAAKVYYNYTGQATCLNISQTATGNLGIMGWYYQVRLASRLAPPLAAVKVTPAPGAKGVIFLQFIIT